MASLGRMIHKEIRLGDIMLSARTFLQMNILHSHYDSYILGDDVKDFNPIVIYGVMM